MCQDVKCASYLGLFPAGPEVTEVIIQSGETRKEKKKLIRFQILCSWSHSFTLSHRLKASESMVLSHDSSERDAYAHTTGVLRPARACTPRCTT